MARKVSLTVSPRSSSKISARLSARLLTRLFAIKSLAKSLAENLAKRIIYMTPSETLSETRFFYAGRKAKSESWHVFREEIDVVGRYKYLGFWFSRGGSYRKHIKVMVGKMQKAANEAWGVMTRTRLDELSRRLHLMDLLVKSGGLYWVEI